MGWTLGCLFERFTNQARQVVVLAQEEARRLRHNFIGTEHILLGLLRERDGLAFRVLEGFGMSLDGTRKDVASIVGPGKRELSGHIPFTPRAKKTLELSLREALQLHHGYIDTEHILLGILREGDGVGAQVLKNYADLSSIRMSVLDLVPSGPIEATRSRRWLRRASPPGSSDSAPSAEPRGVAATPAAGPTPPPAPPPAGPPPYSSPAQHPARP